MKFIYPGLTEQEVVTAREQYGANTITNIERETFWEKLWDNYKDPIIIILLVALGITVVLAAFGQAEWYESVGIALAIFIATFIATWSEHSNENAFRKLLEEASLIRVKVFRNQKLVEISINDLVVGDHILLQPGDTVPTDGFLLAGHLEINEASLTGESEAVKKHATSSESKIEEVNRVFRATLIEDGEAVMKATAVGDKTRYGETMKEIISAEDRLSPLQEKLSVLGGQIAIFAYIGAAFIFIAFLLNKIFIHPAPGIDSIAAYFAQNLSIVIADIVHALILAIIVIVVAVPEGLPMMIAMVLALNMKKLLAVKVLVRKLLGIETAGSLTILFSDKTGTLTQGQLVVEAFLTGNAQQFSKLEDIPETIRHQLGFALRNNTSAVIDTSDPQNPRMVGADRTEQAMLRFVTPLLLHKDTIDIVDVIPFNSSRKFSATQVTGQQNITLIKGAAEVIVEKCTHYLTADGSSAPLTNQSALQEQMQKLSARAMRVLAIAITPTAIKETKELPADLILVGVLGMRDALRSTSYESVKSAQRAGIQVVMITGDSRETARAIATDVGLVKSEQEKILTSTELAKMTDEEIKQTLPHLRVVARAFPTDKSRLVRLAKELNWVVGMTGDGVNDAPAVKNADVGFAMGSGTEMTKESSDIVILDDNFSSIIKAVLYGRTLFKSIRKFLIFQLTVSMSALLVAFLGPFFKMDLPLTMTQLLWINIIMDTLAGLALAGEAALNRYLLEKPIPKDEPLISGDMWSSVLVNGSMAALASIIFITYEPIRELFSRGYPLGSPEADAVFLTAFFGFFVFMHLFNTFNARTQGINLFEHILDNKLFLGVIVLIFTMQTVFIYIGGNILRTVPLQPMEWVYMAMFGVVLLPVDLARKFIRNKLFGNPVMKLS
jgi:calcium-translocating P-type ATPase